MGRTLRRTAAFTALWKALITGNGSNASLADRLGAMPRMVVATLRGRYDGLGRIMAMAAATLYVVSPVDMVPEAFLLVLGLADDVIIVSWIAGALISETDRFLMWENGVKTPVGGPIIDGDVA
ncbi:YkvA family protein [Catellatospora vulcania]|uniref:YkvA family protein n=1 Tax=Catellatospora vulcania TaxID=1460450 RepID=UPI0012D42996|nr:YkvA family protein [Catellatospora vulcania]